VIDFSNPAPSSAECVTYGDYAFPAKPLINVVENPSILGTAAGTALAITGTVGPPTNITGAGPTFPV
jgi:hypothetical protein